MTCRGGKNTLVIHNTCEDSLLAAPIILDLVLLAELLTRIEVRKKALCLLGWVAVAGCLHATGTQLSRQPADAGWQAHHASPVCGVSQAADRLWTCEYGTQRGSTVLKAACQPSQAYRMQCLHTETCSMPPLGAPFSTCPVLCCLVTLPTGAP
jgi:hypothetical protein